MWYLVCSESQRNRLNTTLEAITKNNNNKKTKHEHCKTMDESNEKGAFFQGSF
jgi:hypothetical protein